MRCDVAIIGGGPVGLLLGNLLGRRGLSVRIFEKQPNPYPLPRAIHFDGEAMRVFQAAGLAGQVLVHTHVGVGMLFQNSLGETLIDWSRAQDIGPMGWHESYRFFQPGLEDVLRQGLDRFPDETLTMGAEVAALTTDGVLTLADGSQVEATYVVGCDGADSVTRQAAGLVLDDLGFNERWVVVDALLKRPRPDLGDHSIQHCDPDAPATYVRGTNNWRRWELRLNECEPDPDDAEIWRRLAKWITPDDATVERAAVYTFRSMVAQRWRKGRVFIAGDAAHQMPPFMGQGMCAGVRDVANLAWKLSYAVQLGEDAILDTYESERKPHVTEFIDLTMRLGRLINQTAAGEAPSGRMKSIWPKLGAGLGDRDGVAGGLAPQVRLADGRLSDDVAKGGFYAIARRAISGDFPVFQAPAEWLDETGIYGAVVRPDGYVLTACADRQFLNETIAELSSFTTVRPPV